MRRGTAAIVRTQQSAVPRGWIVLVLALASWGAVAGMASGLGQFFAFVSASI
jgi:hypothetical protein